ncbi:MAG: ATP-dependent metallopeptidase FtsH/Yme1/Tma family protein, partial [Deltaproteobacteria bacterium]|nr:ATP-dependent metallopeptidase FtsH/Yme1/Tma family protein [Deltaproteobacteria bacterium]
MNQQFYRNMALWVVILVMVLLLITMLRQSEPAPPEKDFTEFLAMVESSQVRKVVIEEGHIRGESIDGEFTSYVPAVTEE